MRASLKKESIKQLLIYLFVGGSGFLLDLGTLALLRSGFGMPAWLSAAAGFLVGTVYTFALHRKLTFSNDLSLGKSIYRYIILLAFNTVATSIIVELFEQWLDLYVLGKIISTAATTVWNFPIMKLWIYPNVK